MEFNAKYLRERLPVLEEHETARVRGQQGPRPAVAGNFKTVTIYQQDAARAAASRSARDDVVFGMCTLHALPHPAAPATFTVLTKVPTIPDPTVAEHVAARAATSRSARA